MPFIQKILFFAQMTLIERIAQITLLYNAQISLMERIAQITLII